MAQRNLLTIWGDINFQKWSGQAKQGTQPREAIMRCPKPSLWQCQGKWEAKTSTPAWTSLSCIISDKSVVNFTFIHL